MSECECVCVCVCVWAVFLSNPSLVAGRIHWVWHPPWLTWSGELWTSRDEKELLPSTWVLYVPKLFTCYRIRHWTPPRSLTLLLNEIFKSIRRLIRTLLTFRSQTLPYSFPEVTKFIKINVKCIHPWSQGTDVFV